LQPGNWHPAAFADGTAQRGRRGAVAAPDVQEVAVVVVLHPGDGGRAG
jgi:hypothetical protein